MNKIKKFAFKRILRNESFKRFSLIGIIISALIIISAIVIFIIESNGNNTITSFMDSIWWSIVTITTVGYGDVVPKTSLKRIVGIFLIFIGFTLFSLFTGIITTVMVEDKLRGAKGLKQIKKRNHIVICGWNETVETMLNAFTEKSIDDMIVLIGDFQPDFFTDLEAKYPTLSLGYIRGDYTQTEILNRANVRFAKHVIVLPDANLMVQSADDRSIIVANTIKFISKDIHLTVQLINIQNKPHLKQIGVDNIVIFKEFGGYLIANNVLNSHYISFYNHLVHSREHNIITKKIPQSLIGQKYSSIVEHFYKEEQVVLIGLITERPKMQISDIFSDEGSTIDAFIKNALQSANSKLPEQNYVIHINPSKDYEATENDSAIVIG